MLESLLKSDVDDLSRLIPDGSLVAMYKNISAVPSELVRALIRAGVRDLHVIGVPTSGYAADLLIGAGCVSTVETSAVTLDEIGLAPRFIDAVQRGSVRVLDATCPAIYSALRAGEKGIPFIPIRGLIGSDVLRHRPDYRVIDNPFAEDDPIVVVPAINPDFALVHVSMVDHHGNVYCGKDRDVALMSHAAKQALVTAESVYEGNLLDDPRLAPATMSSIYVGAIALAERGGWPLGLSNTYGPDNQHLQRYRQLAKSTVGFASYLNEFVWRAERIEA